MSCIQEQPNRRSASKCQGKWPDQTLDQAFGLPEVLIAVSTSRLSCKRAAKTNNIDAGLGFIFRISVKMDHHGRSVGSQLVWGRGSPCSIEVWPNKLTRRRPGLGRFNNFCRRSEGLGYERRHRRWRLLGHLALWIYRLAASPC